MAWTDVEKNYDFYAQTLNDKKMVLENTTSRSLEQFELVLLNGYFGEVMNVEDVADGEDAIVNIDSFRTIRTSQVGDSQTFAVGDIIWFDPNGNSAAGALYDSNDSPDFIPVGVVTAIVTGHENVEFRPFVQDTDLSLVRDEGDVISDITSDVTDLETNQVKVVDAIIDADASGGVDFDVVEDLGMADGDIILDVAVIATVTETNGTLTLSHKAGNDITDAIACATDNAVERASSLDQAEVAVDAAVNLTVTAAGDTAANPRGIVRITYRKA